ncbi:hypothetical protein CCB80_04430 [Armatimonadetes bacterium Uphvl-Ar1]|nr:hypothetical protein CCB80_04430 [Armatimonadetes bacterium Uphvl-Ar1]
MTVEGLDEVTTFHRNAQGIVYSNHWTRNWLESGWRLNGNTFSNGGIGGPSLSPGAPAGNTDGITTPVEMTSEGTLKVVVQYSGDPQQMPTEVGVVVDSTAYAAFLPSGNSQADNGLGDESEYSSFMIEEGVGGLGGERSSGRNLRIIPLNSSGYGELEFSPSASATSSANSPLVWAEAQSATATLDSNRIGLSVSGAPFWKATPLLSVENHNALCQHENFTYQLTFNSPAFQREAIVEESHSAYSRYMRFPIALFRNPRSVSNVFSLKTPLHFIGTSTFYQGEQIGHGDFSWTITNPNPNLNPTYHPMSGAFPWVISTSTTQGSFAANPIIWIQHFPIPGTPSLVIGESDQDVGSTQPVIFEVNYRDGVKAKVKYDVDYVESSVPIQYSQVFEITPEHYPLANFTDRNLVPVHHETHTQGLYVLSSSHEFLGAEEIEQYASSTAATHVLNLGVDVADFALRNAPYAQKLAAPAVRIALQSIFSEQLTTPATFPLSRDGAFPRTEVNPLVQLDWDANYRSNLKWRVTSRQGLIIQYITTLEYNESGFLHKAINSNTQYISPMRGYHTLWVEPR